MDDPNITIEEYIRFEKEKARRRCKVFNWETATYGKIWYNEDVHDLRSVETEFPAIVFNDALTSEVTLSCEPMVSPLNDNKIDFRISSYESEDKDYTPTVSYFDDLDFFKDFENEFPAIVYNNAQTSKSDLLTEPILNPQHIDEFNLKDETSLSECDEEEQNVLNFNDLFPFNVIYPNDSKSDKDNDDDKVDIEHSSGDLSVKPLPDIFYTAYPNLMDTAYRLSGRYPVFIFSTVYTAYSLNEYSVFDTGPREGKSTNIGGESTNLEILKKARRRGKVYNWETGTYDKIWYDEDVHDLRFVEIEFPAIVFNDELTSEKSLSCEPKVSSLNNNEIDFRISFDESDDEDYTVIFDKNSFSYKIIFVNDLKTDSENDNEKVNMPSFPSPEPKVNYFDDLDFLLDFENEFPAIVYNDALTSKSDSSTEPVEIPQHIDEFNLKDEASLSECDEEEQNILYFDDLFPFNVIYHDDSKSNKDNDDDKIDIKQSLGGGGALLETIHSKSERMKLHTSLANIAWQIWKSQNGKVFNACQLFPPHMISSVHSMVSDFNSLFSTSYPTSSALVYHDVPQESSL
ncbi:hypothetical protein Tco_1395166, partial [Tanacetum coccineum]